MIKLSKKSLYPFVLFFLDPDNFGTKILDTVFCQILDIDYQSFYKLDSDFRVEKKLKNSLQNLIPDSATNIIKWNLILLTIKCLDSKGNTIIIIYTADYE